MNLAEWVKSRRFFVTSVIGLAFVLLREKIGIPIDEETAQTITQSLVLWIIGESAAATVGWSALLKSPRFWALVAAIVNAVAKDRLGLRISPETIQHLIVLLQTLLTGYAMRPAISEEFRVE